MARQLRRRNGVGHAVAGSSGQSWGTGGKEGRLSSGSSAEPALLLQLRIHANKSCK